MTDTLDIDAPPKMVECVCDRCLLSMTVLDSKPLPRCPRCRIRLTPGSDEPRDRYSSQRP
jgi:hypothetical protein